MVRNLRSITISYILLIIITVIITSISFFTPKFWDKTNVKPVARAKIQLNPEMTPLEVAKHNKIPLPVIKKALSVSRNQVNQSLKDLPINEQQAMQIIMNETKKVRKLGPQNIAKSRIKFVLWFIYLVLVFFIVKRSNIQKTQRLILYGITIILFGVLLGAEPSPVRGTKSALIYLAEYKAIFKPALIGLGFFIVVGLILANKFFCGWGCQFGSLQDFIFRLFRNKKDNHGIIKQIKTPFWVSNSSRIIVFVLIFFVALIFSFDFFTRINPFHVFSPAEFGIIGIVSVCSILILSSIMYRPFCYFFCPFGLISWISERISIYKIRIIGNKCKDCEICIKACPSKAMEDIYNQRKIKTDCFSCMTCVSACPTKAIQFTTKGKSR